MLLNSIFGPIEVSKIPVKMLKMCFTVLKMKQKWESRLKYWITEIHNPIDRLGG